MHRLELFRAFQGVLTTAQLLGAGIPRTAIDGAVAAERLERLRRGWVAWQATPAARAAVVDGGCVSCLSALAHHGAWLPRGEGDHVRRADGQRDARRAAKGCRPHGRNPAVRAAVDDVETAWRCALRCAPAEQLVAVGDSLLHRGIASLDELEAWSRAAPAARRALLRRLDARAEAGTESLTRVRLRRLGLDVRIQHRIGRRRVDVLVGDRLVLECDSVEHHADPVAYERDRAGDRALAAMGYHVVRLTWRQIHEEWPAIEADILAFVRAGHHRWARSAGGARPGAPRSIGRSGQRAA